MASPKTGEDRGLLTRAGRRPIVRTVPTPAALAGLLLAAIGPATGPPKDCAKGEIGRIGIVRHEIFDQQPRGLSWPFRLVNRLHAVTRENVVRRELLLGPGDCLDHEALGQTERNLRRHGFLRDARVETLPHENAGQAETDVRVSTFDTWSTVPNLRFAKVGNRLVWTVGIAERNLLGGGQQIEVARRSDVDRSQTVFSFRDPRLGGSRLRAAASFSDRSDGRRTELELGRPFFALTTGVSFRARLESFDQLDPVYENGERVADLPHDARWLELEGGRAVRRTETTAVRLHLAYRNRLDHVAGDIRLLDGRTGMQEPISPPARRRISADVRRFGIAEVGLSLVEHRFQRLTHVNRFERAEDFNLGHQFSAALATSTHALGGERGSVFFVAVSERKGLEFGPGRFLLGELRWSGRHRRGRWENAVGEARLNGLRRLGRRALMLTTAGYRHGTNLDPETQVTLGAQNGLRGYPVHQWVGSRSLLFASEARFFVANDIKQLVSFAVVPFAAAGYAWPEPRAVALRDLRGEVGLGLLVGRNRLATRALRLDLAYAFNPAPGRGRWLLSIGSQFEFLR